ncbi:MAG: UvrD-helicase domain-containing protein [Deltaproteobacteria bacterium]|nr:UvrD-helicase domain-containing protein [Deltaproteobacteria bacterium]MBW2070203.1 UvrD-helicase domain-containing protein [Deltaproteobacteria bacterium]
MIANLNAAQRKAVEYGNGPVLILAGAGTGKTRTLVYRLAHLIQQKEAAPARIMAVTFTRKAANEMKSRLAALLPHIPDIKTTRIGTFHSLSGALLREATGDHGQQSLLSEADQLALIKEILQQKNLSSPRWQLQEVRNRISLAQGELLTAKELAATEGEEFASLYELYQQEKLRRDLLDFDDLIGLLLQLWSRDQQVRQRHQRAFAAVLVDEFQDVNRAQYRWVQVITAAHRNLWVVGDSDQSIYSFRGSHVDIFHRFQEDYPEAAVIRLQQNYRCSKRILAAATAVISRNNNPLSCALWSAAAQGPLLRVARCRDEFQEARFVVEEIERLLGGSSHYRLYQQDYVDTPDDGQFCFSDIAILYRTHVQNRPLQEALSQAGIPFQTVGGKAPFATRAAETLLAYLHFAANPSSEDDLPLILDVPPRGLGAKARQWFAERLTGTGGSAWEALCLSCRTDDLPGRYQGGFQQLHGVVAELQRLVATEPLTTVLERAWKMTGLSDYFGQRSATASESYQWLQTLAPLYGPEPAQRTLAAFLEDLRFWQENDFYDPRADAVSLMTVHAVKGLEFPVIFVCGMDQGLFPLLRRQLQKEEMEEERRLFYVAMTRARHTLVLSSARRRFLFGEKVLLEPSRFLSEIPPEYVDRVAVAARSSKKKSSREKQLSLF